MKKIVLAALAFSTFCMMAQTKFGIRLSPSISNNRVNAEDFTNNGVGLRYSAGVFADFYFSESVAFNTGLSFATKRNGFKDKKSSNKSVYNTQHIQLPLALRFITDEVSDNLKLYFLVGGVVDVKITEKVSGDDQTGIYEYAKNISSNEENKSRPLFQPIDLGLNFGAGVEYKLSDNNSLLLGFSYQHGLVNMINPLVKMNGESITKVLKSRASSFNLDIGLKF